MNALVKIAKEKKIKRIRRFTKNELENILKLSDENPEEFYEKYCKYKRPPRPILALSNTGRKKKKFPSFYAVAKYFHTYPHSVKWRVLNKKIFVTDDGEEWMFFFNGDGIESLKNFFFLL